MNPSPSLPQHDAANAEDRKQLLYAARQQYQYDHLFPLATPPYFCFDPSSPLDR
jgi:hypothetical protein